MNQLFEQFVLVVNAFWQRRFYALTVAWLVCLVGWAAVASMPNSYKSSGRLFIDTSNILRPLLKGLAVERDLDAELELMKRTLTSRANLANVARLADLDITATTPSQMEALLESLKGRTEVRSEGAKLMSISFVDSDPVRARDVVQAFITTIIETNLGQSRKDIDAARKFLDSQLDVYERQLQEAEQRLAKFREEKLSKLPSQAEAQRRSENLQNELLEVEANLRRAISQRDMLRRRLEAGPQLHNETRLMELENSLNEMLVSYTEQHPEVIALRRKLEALRKSEETRSQGALNSTDGVSDEPRIEARAEVTDPAHEQIRLDLAQQETDVSFYVERAGRIRNQLQKLERSIAQIPEVETEFKDLNRDYEVIKQRYSELVSRREQARLSRDREVQGEKIQFRLVDPPRIPSSPSGPSRSKLLTVTLLMGIGAGVGFTFFLGLVIETFSGPEHLRRAFPLPVLGTVSVIESVRRHTWEVAKSSTFIGSFLLLFAVYGGLLWVERQTGLANISSAEWVADSYQEIETIIRRSTSTLSGMLERI